MPIKRSILVLAVLSGLAAAPQAAQSQDFARTGEQNEARRALLDGEVMPFSIIKRRVSQKMGDARYIGMEFDSRNRVYRLKYESSDSQIIWVDVDGRSGEILAWTKKK